jgi:catechol 2,3-dioxygenase-like lactoylglutathione lyase family enzyme
LCGVILLNIKKIDHVGIRVIEKARAVKFYETFGFKIEVEVDFDSVIIMKNNSGVEINLIVNGIKFDDGKNILMDIPSKYAGFTHIALQVDSIPLTLDTLEKNNIAITQGPVTFGKDGQISVFVRDPDRNTIEFRGRVENEDEIEGLEFYDPKA